MKGATLARALNQGIQTARLPISENIQLKSSTVLTINQGNRLVRSIIITIKSSL